MPVTQSAKKALRRDRRRTLVNLKIKKKLKSSLKEMRRSPSVDNLKGAYQSLDRAAKKKYIHRKKADRLKSRLGKLLLTSSQNKTVLTKSKPGKKTKTSRSKKD